MNKDNTPENKTTAIKQDNTLPIIAIGLSAVALITTLFTAAINPAFAHAPQHEPRHSQSQTSEMSGQEHSRQNIGGASKQRHGNMGNVQNHGDVGGNETSQRMQQRDHANIGNPDHHNENTKTQ